MGIVYLYLKKTLNATLDYACAKSGLSPQYHIILNKKMMSIQHSSRRVQKIWFIEF